MVPLNSCSWNNYRSVVDYKDVFADCVAVFFIEYIGRLHSIGLLAQLWRSSVNRSHQEMAGSQVEVQACTAWWKQVLNDGRDRPNTHARTHTHTIQPQ